MEIDDLKNIFKEKKASGEFTGTGEYDSLITKLRKSERKVWVRSMLMTFFMGSAFYILGGKVLSLKQYETLTYAGMYLIFAAMAAVFLLVWSSVIIMRKKEMITPSVLFLQKVRRKLARRTLIRKTVIPVYLTAITVGVTLVYIEVLASLEMMYRLAIHLIVILFFLGVSYIASRRERTRYERVYKPMESQIDLLLNEMEPGADTK